MAFATMARETSHFSRRGFVAGAGLATGALAVAGTGMAFADEAGEGVGRAAVGEAIGKNGHMNVQVVMEDDKIVRINVLYSHETKGLGDVAMETLTELIIDNQTLNVDTVAGATLSSAAFLLAVGGALEVLGEDVAAWEKRDHAVPADPEGLADAYDIVVVGTGGAGFAAAISAANKGKSVLLLEKLGIFGGSTALSGGEMATPCNWIQVNMGLEDSPEQLAADMLAGGDNVGDPDLVNIIANGVYDAADWLTYEGGVAWEHNLLFFGGHSVQRSLIPKGHKGNEMTTKLTGRAETISNLTLVKNMKAVELVMGDDGAVAGIKVESTVSGTQYEFACRAVIMAAGGFGANVEMRAEANPDYGSQFNSTDCVGAQGEGTKMAQAVGADTVNMDLIQAYPICDIATGALLYLDDMRLDQRTVMFNVQGQRFVEELGRRDVLSSAILAQAGECAYEIWDQAAADETRVVEFHYDEFENLSSRGLCVKADTIEECCEPFGIDAEALKETLAHWNEMADAGEDTDFDYRGKLSRIDTPPYYIMTYKPAVHYTMGGLRINTGAEVLDAEGNPIPGLYAAGENAGGKMGTNRLGSTSMSDIYVFGRIAGNNAADYVG